MEDDNGWYSARYLTPWIIATFIISFSAKTGFLSQRKIHFVCSWVQSCFVLPVKGGSECPLIRSDYLKSPPLLFHNWRSEFKDVIFLSQFFCGIWIRVKIQKKRCLPCRANKFCLNIVQRNILSIQSISTIARIAFEVEGSPRPTVFFLLSPFFLCFPPPPCAALIPINPSPSSPLSPLFLLCTIYFSSGVDLDTE